MVDASPRVWKFMISLATSCKWFNELDKKKKKKKRLIETYEIEIPINSNEFKFIKTLSGLSERLIMPEIVPSFTRNVRTFSNFDFRMAIASIRFHYLHPMPDTSFRIDRGIIFEYVIAVNIFVSVKPIKQQRRVEERKIICHFTRINGGPLALFVYRFVSRCVTPCSRVCRNIVPSRHFMFNAGLYKLYFLIVARRRKRMEARISIDHASHYRALIIEWIILVGNLSVYLETMHFALWIVSREEGASRKSYFSSSQ